MNIFVVIEINKKYHHFSLILFSQSLKLISNKNNYSLRTAFQWFSSEAFKIFQFPRNEMKLMLLYIKKQHDCRRRIHWRNKQSSRLFFVRFFSLQRMRFTMWSFRTTKISFFIKLHFFLVVRKDDFLFSNCI